ncbi:MAG: hypothetical protein K2M30_01925 [Desulfovibrionaceae bacterium]|nr:hypothetical protein [Desulfovibrionaceae bacterium]
MSITSLLQTANSIINTASAAQMAVGQNTAGMNDPNYHRVTTTLIAKQNGVSARFTRAYNQYTERSFISEATSQYRWTTQNQLLTNIQSLFNESGERDGIGKTLTQFFTSWSGLSTNPSSTGSKVEVIEVAKTLSQLIQNTYTSIMKEQDDARSHIESDVRKVNSILDEIASLNRLISTNSGNNFTLLDKRDSLTRELAQYIDVSIVNSSEDTYTLTTKSGYTLVSGDSAYSLELKSNVVSSDLIANSTYTGSVNFTGSSAHEYKIETVQGGAIGTAQIRISIDGGKTWITNPATGDTVFTTTSDPTTPIKAGELELWFDAGKGALSTGDSFTIVPKLGLFWSSTTSSLINITPQTYADGTENTSRVTGGSLGGLFAFKDGNAGTYKNQLDTFAKELIWNVNRIYSQGASATMTTISGTQQVQDTTVALGTTQAQLPYGDRLQAGSFTLYEQDATGKLIPHTIQFDPAKDSLETLRDSINKLQNIKASISSSGTLDITGANGASFAFGEDTTGVLTALGLNTFFTGSDAITIGVNPTLVRNPSLVNTGKVIDGSIKIGDNSLALAISGLQNETIAITDAFGNITKNTLFEYYTATASRVGADIASSQFQGDYHKTQAGFWYAKGQSESGVSEEEELMFSMEMQNLYITGTKLIDTARTMLDSLLSVV